jgi:hypothetical protein
MNDNELDALFRQAAEEREVPFDAVAWAKMQQKLRIAHYIKWAKWGLGGLLGLSLGLGWVFGVFVPNKNSQNTDNQIIIKNSDSSIVPAFGGQGASDSNKNLKAIDHTPPLAENQVAKSNDLDNKLTTIDNGRQIINHKSSLTKNSKWSDLNLNQNSQVLDNQVVKSNDLAKDKSKIENDSKLNQNSQTLDNQVVKSNNLAKDKSKIENDSKLNQNSQTLDNQVVKSNNLAKDKSKIENDLNLNQNSQVLDNQIVKFNDLAKNKSKLENDLNLNQNSQVLDNQTVKFNDLAKNKSKLENDLNLNQNSQVPDNQTVKFNDLAKNKSKLENDLNLNQNSQVFDNQVVVIKTLNVRPTEQSEQKTLPDSLTWTQATQPRFFNRWALQVSLAPDWSAVGTPQGFKIGEHIGVSLEYQVLRRLSIVAGVAYSNKKYTANPDEYQPYAGVWQRVPKPEVIDAGCQVLEMPLNVRYYAFENTRNRWFVSSGISSYWMLRERYLYDYKAYTYPDWVKDIRNENRHLLSIANFSLGWQRNLSPRWSFQVEPYLKIPLGAVGYGKVRLITAGAFLTLKYQFLAR